MTKTCASCHRELPVTEFRRHKGHGDGFDSRCKECMRRDAAAKKKLQEPAVAQIDRKPRHALDKAAKAMVEPYLALRGHQRQCFDGCDEDLALVDAAVEAYERFFVAFSEFGYLPPHGKTWVTAALENPLLLLNVPPRHAKTTIMAKWFVIWQYACDRDTQVILISKTTTLGEQLSYYIANQLETNEELIKAFGRFRPKDLTRPWRIAKGELEVEGKDLDLRHGLSLQVRGSGQAILGMEADWVIADDMTDRKVAKSETERLTEWDFFLGDVLTRLAPDGKAFCIGQRVHAEDLYGRLAKVEDEETGERAWHQIRTPAINANGEALWPEVWPLERLARRRKAVGGPLFQCMFQQTPEYAGEFVPKWWLTGDGTADHPGCYDAQRTVGEGWVQDKQFLPVTRVMSVDPSPTNYAGIIVSDVLWLPNSPYFNTTVVDIRRDKYGQNMMLEVMRDLQSEYHCQALILETNSAKWLHEDVAWHRLVAMFPTAPIGHNTTRWNKNDQLLGVWSLAADFESGRIRLPMGDADSRDTTNLLVDEVLAYPNGSTDDVLMALWFIKANYRKLMPRGMLSSYFNGGGGRGWDVARSKNRWDAHRKVKVRAS